MLTHGLVLFLIASINIAQSTSKPTLVSVARIWDAGEHNAFTDLIRWRNRWYCTFREAGGHVGGDGRIRVLVSDDGEKWVSTAVIRRSFSTSRARQPATSRVVTIGSAITSVGLRILTQYDTRSRGRFPVA